MFIGYRARAALTSLALALSLAARQDAATLKGCRPPDPAIYSPQALRHMRTLLQLRLLESRKERLALVVRVIAHHVPVDTVLAELDRFPVFAQGAEAGGVKHSPGARATPCW